MKTNLSLDFSRTGAGSLLSFKTTGEGDDFCSEWNYGNGGANLPARELRWRQLKGVPGQIRNSRLAILPKSDERKIVLAGGLQECMCKTARANTHDDSENDRS